jgi:hypothetical protein
MDRRQHRLLGQVLGDIDPAPDPDDEISEQAGQGIIEPGPYVDLFRSRRLRTSPGVWQLHRGAHW